MFHAACLVSVFLFACALMWERRENSRLRKRFEKVESDMALQHHKWLLALCVIRRFRIAADPIVTAIAEAGDNEDWVQAAETSRRYEWHELEPLASCMENSRSYE